MSSSDNANRGTCGAASYLGYLDKEMSIMGILSAFCMLTVAAVANAFKDAKVAGDSLTSTAWTQGGA